ncbi:MAG: hypothetical protein AAGA29_09580 [Planctomycetota bacterium]
MAQMQNQLQRMQQQQQAMQQAMQQLNQQGAGGGQGGQPGQWGTAPGGNPYGQHSSYNPANTHAANDIQNGEGRVIATWTENGEMAAGEAQVEYNNAVTEARSAAERAVTEDRVPRRYHDSIRDYFESMPEAPGHTAPAESGAGDSE